MRLENIREIKGKLVLKSGLHIGSGDMEMQIGGIDNQVIKHPHTREPFIPGSSIKGKVRSLLETRSGLLETETDRDRLGQPLSIKLLNKLKNDDDKAECEKILKLFGAGAGDGEEEEAGKIGPTRVVFSDCALNKDWIDENKDFPLIEVKSENRINRVKGTAEHPRFTERVPAGAEFKFHVAVKVFKGDGDDLVMLLLQGLRMLEMDYLGGNGSRGYGRVEFEFDDEDIREKFDGIDRESLFKRLKQ